MFPDINKVKSILVKQNYISEEDHKSAEAAEKQGESYVGYLIKSNLLSATLLGQAIGEAYKVPFHDFRMHPPSKELIGYLPEEAARANRAIIALRTGHELLVATDNLDNTTPKTLAALLPHHTIKVAYTLPIYIDEGLKLYAQPLQERFSTIIHSGERIAPELVNEIIAEAVKNRASDIHFESQIDHIAIRYRIDGTLHLAGEVPKGQYETILNRLKVESGMRIDEHMSAQDGAMQRKIGDLNIDLRASLIPTVHGEKVVLRVLSSYVQGIDLKTLGFSAAHQAILERVAAKPFGMILTVGPTGSGKTTTLYALLKMLNQPDVNITTIEDPVEYKLAGTNQIQVNPATNMTFARGLRAIVRQDPDIVLVGEIRDAETAEISVNAALTGHLLFSTFHANNAATALPRLADMGLEPFLLASTLELVIGQRLVRQVCESCRYSMSAKTALQQNSALQVYAKYFDDNDTLYAGKGCNVCNGSGFKGRLGVFELLEITSHIQDLISSHTPTAKTIAEAAAKNGMVSMFDDGIVKVKQGLTSLDELLRVVEAPQED